MPARIRRVVVVVVLLAMLVPLTSRTGSTQSEDIELYRSVEFGYFFFYDASVWEIVEQESEPGSDFVRFSDGEVWAIYWAFAAQGMTPEDCVSAVLDNLYEDPAIVEIEAFPDSGPPQVHDGWNGADSYLIVTVEDSDGRFKLATREECTHIVPGVTLLYTSFNVPTQPFNEGRRAFENVWLSEYLPSYESNEYWAPIPLVDSQLGAGSLDAEPTCPGDSIYGAARAYPDFDGLTVEPSAFVVAYDSGEVAQPEFEWLYPATSSDTPLFVARNDVALFKLEIEGELFDLYYGLSDGTFLHLGRQSGPCAGAGGAAPIISDMDE